MLTLPPSVQIYLACVPVDGRKGFDALAAVVRAQFGDDPMSGHLFVFISSRRNRLRILYWDRNGWCMYIRRLERGTFRVPEIVQGRSTHGQARVTLEAGELAMLLEGIELRGVRRRPRWSPETEAA